MSSTPIMWNPSYLPMVLDNKIRDGKTQAAVLKVDALLRAGEIKA